MTDLLTTTLPCFQPLPLLRNPHLQTVLGLYLKGGRFRGPTTLHFVPLPDGDQLVLHDNTPAEWRPGRPIAVILHGLTGSARSNAVVSLARMLLRRGVRTVRVDLRGAGRGFALARRSYNVGCSDDVRAVLEHVHADAPDSPLFLAGISLGGNVALKLAGEAAERPVPGLARVAALAPPIDPAECVRLLEQRGNRFYERHFVSDLVRAAARRSRLYPDPPLPEFPKRMTVRLFDELYTAPRGGFHDAADYYARSSAAPLVSRIPVPALVLTARDDPFIAVAPFERLTKPRHVEVRITDHGGHVGFLGWDGAGGICWGERQVVDWLTT
jgi:predicted alpha/beta-fold hydrolase